MDLPTLLAALGLVFIIEGIGPFLKPGGMRRLYFTAARLPNRELRIVGLVSIIVGLALLVFAPR